MKKPVRMAVVGATGVVGREILAALQDLDVPASTLTAMASERSEGLEIEYADETLSVETATMESFRGMSVVYLATPPEASKKFAKAAQAAGAWVVDTSSAFRRENSIPLVLEGVNDNVLQASFDGQIVSMPSATTVGLLQLIEPLRKTLGVLWVNYTALVPASHWGERGVRALERQTTDLLSGREPEAEFLPHRMAFNWVPQVGPFEGVHASEEAQILQEASRIWAGQTQLPSMGGTVVHVPVFYGTGLSVSVQLREAVSVERVRRVFEAALGLKVLDTPQEGIYPMPMLVTADPSIHVGRLRSLAENWVNFVAAFDNAGKGAARHAVNVGQKLLQRL